MDNLINSKNIKCRINAINTKLSDNARFINNANNLIPITIFISNDKGKYYIQEHYADLSDKTLTIDDLDVYLVRGLNTLKNMYKMGKTSKEINKAKNEIIEGAINEELFRLQWRLWLSFRYKFMG